MYVPGFNVHYYSSYSTSTSFLLETLSDKNPALPLHKMTVLAQIIKKSSRDENKEKCV